MKRRVMVGSFVTCPFCGYLVTILMADNMSWCGSCRVEWYDSRDGDWIVFDNKRKTPKYAWAKAIAAAGGMSMGTVVMKK